MLATSMISGPKRMIAMARRLRREMSLPEVLLWQYLRRRPLGFKFRRQQAADVKILDFYCHKAGLCVEVDGIAHDMGDAPARDAARDAWLARERISVLRIPAAIVLKEFDVAAAMVEQRLTP